MKLATLILSLCCLAGCGYHRLDHIKKTAPWTVPGETISLGKIYNNTKKGGLEEIFTKALEDRIIASSPWKLAAPGSGSRWILQGVIVSYEVHPMGLNLNTGQVRGSAGAASRVEIIIVASFQLLDGQTGALVMDRPQLTFKNQYRLDQNFASFDSRELQVIDGLADDFAGSFLTQLLEGYD